MTAGFFGEPGSCFFGRECVGESGAESFRLLMRRRGYAGTLWVSERTILERLPQQSAGLHRTAVERLARLPMAPEAAAVVEAMAAGERRGITPELRARYSRSGLSHLLAVSGLHTGIVFVLINAVLWWLPLLRRGHLLKNLLAAGAVWLFVAAAGFPPSAVRAAVMCTVLQAALASTSEYVGMNALATAAFGMLLWNPNWFGDISFQLSFLAVAGILAWGVPLCRRCRGGHGGRRLPQGGAGGLCHSSGRPDRLHAVRHLGGGAPFRVPGGLDRRSR